MFMRSKEHAAVHFYRDQYGIKINDINQPMLISRPKQKDRQTGEKREQLLCLIPELAYMTGLTDEMRANFKVMKVCQKWIGLLLLVVVCVLPPFV